MPELTMTDDHWLLEGTIPAIITRPRFGDTGVITVGDIQTWVQVRDVKPLPHGYWLQLNVLMPDHPGRSEQVVDAAPASPGFDGPPCIACGSITFRAGTCWTCPACATTTGCG